MNILLITHLFYPNVGGVEIAALNLSKHYVKMGHRVEVVTSRWPKSLPKSDSIEGIRVVRLPFRLPSPSITALAKFVIRSAECMFRLLALARKSKFDLINLHYISENALYALVLCRIMRLPLVISIHGEDIESCSLRGKFNSWLVKSSLKRATKIVSNSRALLEITANMFGNELLNKAVVIGNGVNLSKINHLKNDVLESEEYILGIGRFVHKKGFDILIESFAQVRDRFPDLKLMLVGDGPEREKLESLSKKLGLEKSVIFCGLLENNEIWKYLINCKFFVLPSRKEPFGIVNLEAMAARKAVIAMNVGGVPEYIRHGENGLLVDDHSPTTLTESMLYLLEEPDIACQMGLNGRKVVESDFTWKVVGNKYLAAYQSVLRTRITICWPIPPEEPE